MFQFLIKVCSHRWNAFLTVKIIMDKISKRSKGYAFIEYTTEEAASAALKEMNGKVSQSTRIPSLPNPPFFQERLSPALCYWCLQIINGWMIVVDVAKSNPPRYSRGRHT
jgi:RNA recognition motif-containing protein